MPTFVAGFMLAVLGLVLCNVNSAHSETIKLEQEGGVYKLPVRINDAVTLPFIVDSGAAEVSIPADVLLVLLRGKTVSKADDLGSSKFTQADGTTVSSERFLLHKMSVGDHVVTDVVANVIPVAGEPLLGQSFLERLPSWTFDNNQHTLAIGEKDAQDAARVMGVLLHIVEASTEGEIEMAFTTLVNRRPNALMVASDPYLFSRRDRLIALAAQYAVPTIYTVRAYAMAGGLISYTSNPDMEYERAVYVGRILNGEKPGDLPVQQPTKFDLVINLKTAKALGLAVPQSLLARADEVIE